MQKMILFFILLGSSLTLNAQQSDLQELKRLNATFIHNFVTNDTISHTKIIHPAFVYITPSGQYVNRREYMNHWLHGFDGYKYWDYRDERIQIFGTTALVHSTNKYVVVKEGKEINGMSMYTDTYVKENGVWKCIQAQISVVSPQYYPGDETIVRKYDYRNQ